MILSLVIKSQTLSLLRLAAEGLTPDEITRIENISKKEIETQLKQVYKQLKTTDPLQALQLLAKTDFKVVDD
ncbi:MAG: LuxR C-terminal-related transcriptional regulator [Cyclobacteriaceae bacterium]|nr:LuxR C-terminal-related transcriptional regulator [Cyclobacteriaceae bacterium]MDW8331342.1 LuxR C-terminal-related transcriptional regulator [Cyclobacteriaceae bacterium]